MRTIGGCSHINHVIFSILDASNDGVNASEIILMLTCHMALDMGLLHRVSRSEPMNLKLITKKRTHTCDSGSSDHSIYSATTDMFTQSNVYIPDMFTYF